MRDLQRANLKLENGGSPSDPSGWPGAAMNRSYDSWIEWRTNGSAMRFEPTSASFGKGSTFCSGNSIRSRLWPLCKPPAESCETQTGWQTRRTQFDHLTPGRERSACGKGAGDRSAVSGALGGQASEAN